MAKKKIKYVCQECGAESIKWLGKCPACGKWNTLVVELIEEVKRRVREVHGVTLTPEVRIIGE